MMSGALASPDEAASPLRSQASPRSSRSNSGQSRFSFGCSSQVPGPGSDSSDQQSPTRGRTLVRKPAHRTINRRATTVHQDRPRNIEWDSVFTQQRLMSRDLTAEPRSIFDSILEPLPPGIERYRSSLSEELYRSATWGTSIDLSRFGDHRDTFALLGLRHPQSFEIALPDEFFERLVDYIDVETYLAIRLSCRCWSDAITRVCPISSPVVRQVPTEILERIYGYLDPIDFNAARHTCRAWMIASLEEKVLRMMLQRGGWRSAADADANLRGSLSRYNTPENINQEWLLSKRLATECLLVPGWTGNGFFDESSLLATEEQFRSTGLRVTSTTDFSELGEGYSPVGDDPQHGSALNFTVSTCNKFVLVAEGCVIYIYSTQDDLSTAHHRRGLLSPLTAVICPHRVLAVSMDTSAQRFAVAALLEGRVGFVCDISDSNAASRRPSVPRAMPTAVREDRGPMYTPRFSSEVTATELTSPREDAEFEVANNPTTARAIAEATLPEIHGTRHTPQSWTMDDPMFSPIAASGSSHDYDFPIPATGHMPIVSGARAIYRNLCSAEDAPRSVAICPQRRCVAFGCAAGIELHWIDALTGHDLNRWFPLTAPSDFLYFLPARPGFDSAKKLRLISSAGHPRQKDALQGRFFPDGGNERTRHQGMTWDETYPGSNLADSGWRGTGWCDHYRAVPVSDGWNILFTDPEVGNLCLGSDAPPGARATKLTRKFTFVGPKDNDGRTFVPSVYASAAELKWGVRIAAGYGDALWLFVVPPDLYFVDKDFRKDYTSASTNPGEDEPTIIRGVQIARVPALADISIDASGGDLTIWTFAADGMAYTWQLASNDDSPPEQYLILRDGTICPQQDSEGDTLMSDPLPYDRPTVHFDGHASTYASTSLSPLHTHPDDRVIDNDGDVVMGGGDVDEGYASEFETAGGVFAIHAPPVWGRWSGEEEGDWEVDYLRTRGEGEGEGEGEEGDEGLGVDVLEGSRLEVEVWCG